MRLRAQTQELCVCGGAGGFKAVCQHEADADD